MLLTNGITKNLQFKVLFYMKLSIWFFGKLKNFFLIRKALLKPMLTILTMYTFLVEIAPKLCNFVSMIDR